MTIPSRRIVNFAGFAICAALMGFALFAQHVLGLEPCPLCVLQRVATIGVGLVFLVAALHDPGALGSRIYGLLVVVVAAAGISVAGRHAYLQTLPPDQVPSCGPGLDYMLEVFPFTEMLHEVFSGSGECAEVVWRFLGITMPGWVLLWLVALGAGALINGWRRA